MFEILLNYGFAWLAVIFSLLLSLKFVMRKLCKYSGRIKLFNKYLGKTHIFLGVLLIVTGFIHGYFSSEYVLSFNLGTIAWALSILLGLSFMARKQMRGRFSWIVLHRVLTVLFLGSIVWHVIDVGGVQILNEIFPEKDTVVYEVSINEVLDEQLEIETPEPTETPEPIETPVSTPAPTATPVPTETTKPAEIPKPTETPEPIETPELETTPEPIETPELETTPEPIETLEQFNDGMKNVVLTDGTYTGVANAYGPGLTVSVTVKNNKLTGIKITEHNEKQSKYYARPMEEIPKAIIDTQSLEVDAISGATFTSIGIVNAVNDALSQAVVSGELPLMKELPQQKKRRG